ERIQLYVQHDRPLTRLEVDAYRQRIARRARREPVAYITGKREFYSLELKVDRRCLIPRPETEHLVETALAELGRRFAGEACLDVADIGTGSGAIAAGVAKGEPRARVTATDIDAGALELAAENLARLGLSGRVQLVRATCSNPCRGSSSTPSSPTRRTSRKASGSTSLRTCGSTSPEERCWAAPTASISSAA